MSEKDYLIIVIGLILHFVWFIFALFVFGVDDNSIEENDFKEDLKKEHLEYIKERESDARYLEKRRNRPFQFE